MGCGLYEQREFQEFCEGAIRPGGLALTKGAVERADFARGTRLLDIGCGLGATAAWLGEQRFVASGIDSSAQNIARAKSLYPGLDLRAGDAAALPWQDAEFGGVLCECTLSIVREADAVLGEIHRVLVPGGKLILSDFYARGSATAEQWNGTCVGGAPAADALQQQLNRHGFEMLHWEDAQQALRDFTAALLWEYGSWQRFWEEAMQAGTAPGGSAACVGYAWSIWQRGESDGD